MPLETVAIRRSGSTKLDLRFNSYLGALLGGAIADAMGWITEFRSSREELAKKGIERLEDYITWTKPTGGRFHTYFDYISKGDYSDDTQLTLCTARSLTADGNFDEIRFVEELTAWLDYSRGAGAAITAGARNLRDRKSASWNRNFYGTPGRGRRRGYFQAGGNGAAMRVAPHGLANVRTPARAFLGTWKNAVITHGHPRALVGALVMSESVRLIAESEGQMPPRDFAQHIEAFVRGISRPKEASLRDWQQAWEEANHASFEAALEMTKQEMVSLLQRAGDSKVPYRKTLTELGCFEAATKGSGTGCVAAAISAFLRWPDDYGHGVLEIVNTHGIDTDTIGSMYGNLAGLRAGSTNIPDTWSVQMQDYEYFISVANVLAKISLRRATDNDLRVDVDLVKEREGHDVVELAHGRTISANRRVVHSLLGSGWVKAVNEQSVKSGGLMLLVDVALDSGQSFRFKSFRSRQKLGREERRKPSARSRQQQLFPKE